MPPEIPLTEHEMARYERQLRIPGFPHDTQRRLKEAHVTVLGLGGTGTSAALYLAAAGVGNLRVVDRDCIELSNLNRQILYTDSALGQLKAPKAGEFLRAINGDICVEELDIHINEENLPEILKGSDFVVDALDQMDNRLLVNRTCYGAGIPANHAFVHGLRAEVITVLAGSRPCLACLADEDTRSSLHGQSVVLGVATGIAGLLQATEAIKSLVRPEWVATGRRVFLDLVDMTMAPLECAAVPGCPCCGKAEQSPC